MKKAGFPSKKESEQRKEALVQFQKRLGIKFKDLSLLDQAFYHRSYVNEANGTIQNNERLEFLGDSVLGMTVASYLYETMKDHPEGDLAKIKSVVVSEMTLSEIALHIGIDSLLCLGNGEIHSGGRQKKAILADATEAVFGAYYLDSGFKNAQTLILELLVPEIHKVWENRHHKDFKTLLQEFAQKKYKKVPKYITVKTTGPDHDREFWISVDVNGTIYGPLSGKSKKEAEQLVAQRAWEMITENRE
ncbi:MAG: ribonuclease III [Treponemataceae bacterium]|nr:ribonuclease III [Treponemataceae bacterium]